jgi:CheY-specific phosphatase CheX
MTASTLFPLYPTAAATFEELALLLPSAVLTEEQEALPLVAAASVRFFGPRSGRLELRTSAGVMQAISANMLGLDAAAAVPLQRDALGELGNVLCGNLVAAMTNGIGVFHLHPPRAMDGHELTDALAPNESCVDLGFDEGRAQVRLFLSPR